MKKFYSSFSTYFLIYNHLLLACITVGTSSVCVCARVCVYVCVCIYIYMHHKKIRKNIENFVILILIFEKIKKFKKIWNKFSPHCRLR